MPIHNLDDLNAVHLDVLKEIGNIGSGSAATALANLVGSSIDINVPNVRTLNFQETIKYMGNEEDILVGLMIKFTGKISGLIMYILPESFVQTIIKVFYGKEIKTLEDMDDMDKSAICEIGNIMAGSYVNAISALTDMQIEISIPEISIDMAGAILSVPAIEYASLGDKVLFIDDNFKIGNNDVKSHMFLIPEMNSLTTLFGKLGIEI